VSRSANPYEQFQGTNLNAKSVVAPVNGYTDQVKPSLFDQTVDRLKGIVGLNKKAPPPAPVFTPGIFRRDLERQRERWVRD
jgi:hypothetical protein